MPNDPRNQSGGIFGRVQDEFKVRSTLGDVEETSDRVMPRSAFYVTPADQLAINITTYFATPAIQVSYRMLLADGTVETFFQQFACTNNLGQNTFVIQLTEGWLLSMNMGVATANLATGQVYSQAFVFRGQFANSILPIQLMGQYLSSFCSGAWPGTPIQQFTDGRGYQAYTATGNPGAGANFSLAFNGNFRWHVKGASFDLTTSAVVANRTVRLQLKNGATAYLSISSGFVQTASTTVHYLFGEGLPYNSADPTFGVTAPWPAEIEVPTNATAWTLVSAVNNLDVGDTLTNINVPTQSWFESF